jgi:hypothetical protein
MQHHTEPFGHLERELGARKVLGGANVVADFGRDFQRSMAAALFVEQALHAFRIERLRYEIEGSSRVAVLAGCTDHRQTVHQMGAQHLVLDLDFVEGKEEGAAADEQPGHNRLRMRMKQTGCGESAATLFLNQ